MTLAHALGITAVAEGVETAEQFAKLRMLKGDSGQGYYWWRPCSAEKTAALLAANLDS
ncbi:MAG: EAL domain-containing protein [Rubrobacteraceae bacterium]